MSLQALTALFDPTTEQAKRFGGSSDDDLNPGFRLPSLPKLRDAAVLVAISEDRAGRAEVLLTRRASTLRSHAGQIAFPGGKIDAEDASPVFAALREAHEEVGLPRQAVEVLGEIPPHVTGTGYRITPVVARITTPFIPRPEPGEVAEIFSVPLPFVLDRNNYRIESRSWLGQTRHYYTVPWGPYYIWGATARILRALADHIDAP